MSSTAAAFSLQIPYVDFNTFIEKTASALQSEFHKISSELLDNLKKLSLSKLTYYGFIAWYLEWIIPWMIHGVHLDLLTANPWQLFGIFGIAAYTLKLAMNMKLFKNYLYDAEHTTIYGQTEILRRWDKAAFVAIDSALTVAAFVGYFCLRAAWASPLFIAIMAAFTLKAVYSFTKNITASLCHAYSPAKSFYDNSTQTEIILDNEFNELQHQRNIAKVKRSAFDLGMFAIGVAATVVFCMNPALGALGLLLTTITHYTIRNKMAQSIKARKEQAIEHFQHLKKKQAFKNLQRSNLTITNTMEDEQGQAQLISRLGLIPSETRPTPGKTSSPISIKKEYDRNANNTLSTAHSCRF
ncbi:MAG: hypothetical protein CMF50_09885 [Legionellales bacterium]|nr:hypothetical protein [Legionellales bacterium]